MNKIFFDFFLGVIFLFLGPFLGHFWVFGAIFWSFFAPKKIKKKNSAFLESSYFMRFIKGTV